MRTKFLLIACTLLCCLSCHKQVEKNPAFVVQASIGDFIEGQWYPTQDVIDRLEEVNNIIPLEKVLVGWSTDTATYRQIGDFLHARGIQMILYLPVFSEAEPVCDMAREAVDLCGNVPPTYKKAGFRFKCPTDSANFKALIAVYEQYFANLPFDGVFLDRVRTQSFVSGVAGVLNCGCPECAEKYKALGVDLAHVQAEYEDKGDEFFNVTNYDPKAGFTFENPIAAAFFKAKGQVVSEDVAKFCDYFRARGLQVGLDLYAPLMAQFVGQDYAYLAQHCDFIKPMLYRRTYAPAGITFEYDLLRSSVPGAKGYPDFTWDVDFLNGQLDAMADLPCAKYPGIEIVYDSVIAPTDVPYIHESLRAIRDCGYEGSVVSWNIMQVPDAHIACLRDL